jgi:death-on-curing protein
VGIVGEIIYLEIAEVIELHYRVMERTGAGSQGIRTQLELESALARPQMAAFYENADIIRQATVLAIGISQNQPFVDGNKRTAYAVSDSFLRANGQPYEGNPIEFAKQLEAVAERTGSLDDATDDFERWLRSHTFDLKG